MNFEDLKRIIALKVGAIVFETESVEINPFSVCAAIAEVCVQTGESREVVIKGFKEVVADLKKGVKI